MIIKIKTNLIEIEITDDVKLDNQGYTKRGMPEMPACIESAVNEAIKLHNSVAKSLNNKDNIVTGVVNQKVTI